MSYEPRCPNGANKKALGVFLKVVIHELDNLFFILWLPIFLFLYQELEAQSCGSKKKWEAISCIVKKNLTRKQMRECDSGKTLALSIERGQIGLIFSGFDSVNFGLQNGVSARSNELQVVWTRLPLQG